MLYGLSSLPSAKNPVSQRVCTSLHIGTVEAFKVPVSVSGSHVAAKFVALLVVMTILTGTVQLQRLAIAQVYQQVAQFPVKWVIENA